MRRILPSLVAAMLLASATVSTAAGDPEQGRIKGVPCMGCHGIPSYTNVYPTYHVPKLGGQHADYIVAALKAYKAGDRSHKTMQAQAASLSEQDMADLAAFFSNY